MGKTSNSKSTHSFVSLLNAYSRDTSTQKKSSFVPVSKKQKNEKYISDPLSRLNQISLSNPQPVVLPSMPSKKRSHSTSPSIPKLVESSPTSQHRSSKKPLSKHSSTVMSSLIQPSAVASSPKQPSADLSSNKSVSKSPPLQSQEDLQLRVDTVVSQRSTEMVQQQMMEIDSSTLILTTHER